LAACAGVDVPMTAAVMATDAPAAPAAMVKTCRRENPLDRAMTVCPFMCGIHFVIVDCLKSRRLDLEQRCRNVFRLAGIPQITPDFMRIFALFQRSGKTGWVVILRSFYWDVCGFIHVSFLNDFMDITTSRTRPTNPRSYYS
jgi:hypothetical protein